MSKIPNPSVATLYEDALVYEQGSAITASGALSAYSGKKTGRSPSDKRIVKEPSSENDVWYVSQILAFHSDTLLTEIPQVGTCQQAHEPRCEYPRLSLALFSPIHGLPAIETMIEVTSHTTSPHMPPSTADVASEGSWEEI